MVHERGLYWAWTLNNYTDDDIRRLAELPARGAARYICWGVEQGANGTPHLQGYLELAKRSVTNRVRELLGGRAHVGLRRGSQQDNINYTSKDGDWVEYGTKAVNRQGARTDLTEAVESLRSGMPIHEFALANPELYCRYRNGLRDIARFTESKEREAPICVWLHGAPGSGKSWWAHHLHDDMWTYGGDGWFDGYNTQSVAIFDDFLDDQLPRGAKGISYSLLLKICDRYPLQVPVKGGFVAWKPRVIIFTSNRKFEELFLGFGDPRALRRRFHVVHDTGVGALELTYEQLLEFGNERERDLIN